MVSAAFTPTVSVTTARAFKGRSVDARRPSSGTALKMSIADNYMAKTVVRESKQAATPFGTYTVQCTEGTASSNSAESKRVAALATEFRLRQSSASAAYADLYATRRAAIVNAAGSHVAESYAISFPVRAAASVIGRAEALRACNRYFGPVDAASQYMHDCVDRQYKAMKVPYGTYTTACCDGTTGGMAEDARVSALAAEFRAKQFSTLAKEQMRYNASLEAIYQGRGCTYEEDEWLKFPKMAGAMRTSTGAYAALKAGTGGIVAGVYQLAPIDERIKNDENVLAIWPRFEMRPAIEKKRSPWNPSPLKDYSYMSQAALKFGIEAQTNPFVESPYQGWTSGWKTKSALTAEYETS